MLNCKPMQKPFILFACLLLLALARRTAAAPVGPEGARLCREGDNTQEVASSLHTSAHEALGGECSTPVPESSSLNLNSIPSVGRLRNCGSATAGRLAPSNGPTRAPRHRQHQGRAPVQHNYSSSERTNRPTDSEPKGPARSLAARRQDRADLDDQLDDDFRSQADASRPADEYAVPLHSAYTRSLTVLNSRRLAAAWTADAAGRMTPHLGNG